MERLSTTAAAALATALLATSPARADGNAEQVRVLANALPVSELVPDQLEPETRFGTSFLREIQTPLASYDEIARLAPSVLSVSPNGPGLGEAAALTIRGFSDGQYNVTFDGIPFADTDDFTHHTNSYFAQQALGSVSVDRGPGTGATIGNATFGGTVALQSVRPSDKAGLAVSGSVGSFDTERAGLKLDTGDLGEGGRLVVDAEQSDSDGALDNAGVERRALFAPFDQPLAHDLTLSVVGNGTWLRQTILPGATRAQIAASGPDVSLGTDPSEQTFVGFNGNSVRTDFGYARLRWEPSNAVSVEETAYTYGLNRHFSNGADPNGETPNGTPFGADDVPGQVARNGLRAFGDVLRAERSWNAVSLRFGVWGEHQANSRGKQEADFTDGGRPNPILDPVPGIPDSDTLDRLQKDSLDTVQPYLEAEWRPWSGFSIVPGLRWTYARRDVAAPVMEGTRLPTYETASYDTLLPSIALRQRLPEGWAIYAQLAEGALAPQLQLLDTTAPASSVSPERTVNIQAGGSLTRLFLAFDGYVIQFDNLAGTRTIGNDTVAFNEGGATYLGLEAEATIALGHGVSLYANGSLNRARDHESGAPVPNAPDATLAGGLLYQHGAWFGSVLDKWVGARFGDTNRQAGLDPFNQLDATLGRTVALGTRAHLRLQLQALNLADSRKIDALAGYTAAAGTPLWYTQPGRSLWFTGTVSF